MTLAPSSRLLALTIATAALCAALWTPARSGTEAPGPERLGDERLRHEQEVMRSQYCADCHPAIYAEHERSTHGRAFTDAEVRLATGRFDHGDCIICHTPRPIFETGIGMNPRRRYYDLEGGNTCMTCHWQKDYDYSTFEGGAECRMAFDDRVGEVEACASCHRNHGTPFQWALSPLGKGKDRVCMDCHMKAIERPVAVGEAPRYVSSHAFPGARDEEHVRRAYAYDARVEGNEVVITIKNRGAGHNFPTELKQRSVESLVVVKDVTGKEVSRSRMVFRDPYKRPYGLHLPVNTQIPSGQSVEHRVPIKVADGTAECELHFKLYFPIEDYHPDLARRLEVRKLVFNAVTPSEKEVETGPEVAVVTPEAIDPALASPANLVDFARPPIGQVEVEVPTGDSPEDIARLIELFQFPVPAANRSASARLVEIGAPAVPQLIAALGSWDNKTYNQAMAALQKIREPAVGPLVEALAGDELYIRLHARELLMRLHAREAAGLEARLLDALDAPLGIERASAASALGELEIKAAVPGLMRALEDRDPDVVRAAAFALAQLDHRAAIPALRAAHGRFVYVETRRDLATAMARLGDNAAVPLLMDGLDYPDDLIRESCFEALFEVTGLHLGYDPLAPRPNRLEAVARLRGYWAEHGPDFTLHRWQRPDHAREATVWNAIQHLGDGGDDEPLRAELMAAGEGAVPGLVKALKYPPGFDLKRAQACELLGRIGSMDGVPALVATLRDPVVAVAAWACWAIEQIGDTEALAAVQRYESRVHTLAASGQLSPDAGTRDALLAASTRTRVALGDESALQDLVTLLLSEDLQARQIAIDALQRSFGFDLDYVANGALEDRRRAAAEWAAAIQ